MKNRILALLVPLLLFGQTVFAGEFFNRTVNLQWIRTDASINGGRAFTVGMSDGNHPLASGTATTPSAPQDTSSAIDIRDHYWRTRNAKIPFVIQTAADTLQQFGTLTLRSSRISTGDSLVVFRDWSADGVTWAVIDSTTGHIAVMDSLRNQGSVPQDSVTLQPTAAVLNADGTGYRIVSISWPVNPSMSPAGITAEAIIGVNFIRFRIHLTAGDFAAAGVTNGVTGSFSYPADEPNYNR